METYVISLKRRPERLKEFYSKYPGNSDNVIVFEAIDGKQYESYDLDDLETQLLNITLQKTTYNLGAFGCFASHYRLWKMLVENPNLEDTYRFRIYEDDAFFVSDYNRILETALQGDVPSFDILYIGGRFFRGFTDYRLKRYNDTKFYKTEGDRGTFSYIITKAGAKKIIEHIRQSFATMDDYVKITIVDTYLNKLFFNGIIIAYDLFPHINWSPINYKSDIQGKNTVNKNFVRTSRNTVVQPSNNSVNKPQTQVKKMASSITVTGGSHVQIRTQRTHRILRK